MMKKLNVKIMFIICTSFLGIVLLSSCNSFQDELYYDINEIDNFSGYEEETSLSRSIPMTKSSSENQSLKKELVVTRKINYGSSNSTKVEVGATFTVKIESDSNDSENYKITEATCSTYTKGATDKYKILRGAKLTNEYASSVKFKYALAIASDNAAVALEYNETSKECVISGPTLLRDKDDVTITESDVMYEGEEI